MNHIPWGDPPLFLTSTPMLVKKGVRLWIYTSALRNSSDRANEFLRSFQLKYLPLEVPTSMNLCKYVTNRYVLVQPNFEVLPG